MNNLYKGTKNVNYIFLLGDAVVTIISLPCNKVQPFWAGSCLLVSIRKGYEPANNATCITMHVFQYVNVLLAV